MPPHLSPLLPPPEKALYCQICHAISITSLFLRVPPNISSPHLFYRGKKLFPFRGSLLINGLGSLFALKGWHAGVHGDGLVNSGKTFSQAFFSRDCDRSGCRIFFFFFFYATFFYSCFVYPLFSPSGGLIKGPVAVAGLLMMQGGSLRSFSLIYFFLLILFTSVVFRNLLCRFRSAVSSSGLFDSVFLHFCP